MEQPWIRFLLFNLGAGLVAALWAAALAAGVAALLKVGSAESRRLLFLLVALKSTLVVLGIHTVMPFPSAFWSTVRAAASPLSVAAPVLLIWSGAGLLVYEWMRHRAFSRLVGEGLPVERDSRLALTLQRVREGLMRSTGESCLPTSMCGGSLPSIRAYLSDSAGSPGIIPGEPARLVMPRRLEGRLDDQELEGIVAHEVAHLQVRGYSIACSFRDLDIHLWSPIHLLISGLFRQQEELACDEVATRLTGRSVALASGILKAYRFQKSSSAVSPVLADRLLGRRSLLQRRLERLLDPASAAPGVSRCRVMTTMAVAGLLIFSS